MMRLAACILEHAQWRHGRSWDETKYRYNLTIVSCNWEMRTWLIYMDFGFLLPAPYKPTQKLQMPQTVQECWRSIPCWKQLIDFLSLVSSKCKMLLLHCVLIYVRRVPSNKDATGGAGIDPIQNIASKTSVNYPLIGQVNPYGRSHWKRCKILL